jgi:hypothetical protein
MGFWRPITRPSFRVLQLYGIRSEQGKAAGAPKGAAQPSDLCPAASPLHHILIVIMQALCAKPFVVGPCSRRVWEESIMPSIAISVVP